MILCPVPQETLHPPCFRPDSNPDVRRFRHIHAGYYKVGAVAALQCGLLAETGVLGGLTEGESTGVQALCVGAQAMPGKPVLIVEDDIHLASFFSLRLSSLITAVEVRAAPSARLARDWFGCWLLACVSTLRAVQPRLYAH